MEDVNDQGIIAMPRIGDNAPSFKAVTTQGMINFPEDYSGSWVILFSHPADWRPGDEVIVPPAGSCGVAKERMESKDEDIKCYDWFFCTKKLDKEKVLSAILKK